MNKTETKAELMQIWDEADELCASFQTPECLTDPDSLKAMEHRAIFIRDKLDVLTRERAMELKQ
jgi:hypothetical protein|tara:strand:- start:36 stop:227 length:192 start_codon:yes stop_codon:yes gene_type:complete